MWRMMYRHARRVGEVQLVKWDHIRLGDSTNIGRPDSDSTVSAQNAVTYPRILKKEDDISYTLPLNGPMVSLLKQMNSDVEYVFEGRGGGPVTQSTIREHLKRVTTKCSNVSKTSKTHRFRHTRGVHMRQEGRESVEARELMQHTYTSTTEDFYWSDLSTDERESLYDTIFEDLGEELEDE